MPTHGLNQSTGTHQGGFSQTELEKLKPKIGVENVQFDGSSKPDPEVARSIYRRPLLTKEPTLEDLDYPGQLDDAFGDKWLVPVKPPEIPLESINWATIPRLQTISAIKEPDQAQTAEVNVVEEESPTPVLRQEREVAVEMSSEPATEPQEVVSPKILSDDSELEVKPDPPVIMEGVNSDLAAKVLRARSAPANTEVRHKPRPILPVIFKGLIMLLALLMMVLRGLAIFVVFLSGIWLGMQAAILLPVWFAALLGLILLFGWGWWKGLDMLSHRTGIGIESYRGILIPLLILSVSIGMFASAMTISAMVKGPGSRWEKVFIEPNVP